MIREIFLRDFSLSSCVLQSTIFLAVGLVSSFILRHRSARAHQVLFLAMMAAVIVPIMSILVKHYELGMFVAEPVVIQSPAEDLARGSNYGAPGIISAEDVEHKPGPIDEILPSTMAGSESAEFPWRSVILYVWIAASLILFARLLVTFVLGVRLLGRALPLECEKIEQALHLARAKLGIDKDVMVRSSRSVRSPVIWCWRRRPVLLVPSAAGRFDNGVDWAGVLCHELAHYKRRDHISGLLAELVVCILPWHPLVWWAKSRLVRLSEQACDDWVVATGQPGTDYAESLLDLTPGGQMAFVPAVVSSKRGLAYRIRRILKDKCVNPRTGAIWALIVSLVVLCLTVGIAFAQTRPAVQPSAVQDKNIPTIGATEPEKTDVQVKGKPDKTSGKLAANRAFFTPPIARIINSAVDRKDCFIDFDNDKLYSPPSDFHSRDREQQEAWKRENGIDASATVSEGAEGLWGEEMVIIPLANVEFDRMTPASFRDFLKQATPGTPAVMTAIGQLPKTYLFKTREGGMGLLQILEVQRKRSPHYIKIRYKMVPRTVEADAKITSNKKLQDLGKAMVMFATDHQRKLPDSLQGFAPYLRNKQDIEWLSTKVKYLGKGKSEKNRPDTVIAYDRSLLQSQQGTNVLFLDAHVEYVQPDRLKKLGISKSKEATGLSPDDAAAYKQLETIIVDLSELIPTTSFSEAIEVISNSVDPPLDIVANWKDLLKNADIEPDTAINMDGLPAVLLGTGLESLLKAVAGGSTKLNYIVDNGTIKIGTLKMLPSKMVHRVYDISDLVGTAADADNLIRRITETIEPDGWYGLSETGEGTITAYPLRQPKKFAVLQTHEIHQQITRFLDDMRSSRDELPEPNLPLAPEVPLITNTFIDEELLEALKDIASMAGIVIIPDEKIVGLVTAELQDVPLETAFDIVLAGTPYVVKKTPYYYLVSSTVELPEIEKRVDSAKKLSNLGKALLIYANDHDDKYPDSLHHLPVYSNVEELKLVLANVKYLAYGKTIAVRPDTVIAYDKKLLVERKGTNVLFNDSHVEFVKPERLKKLGISATAILIDTKILSVSEDFLKDIGLDANSVSSSGAWSEHLVAKSAAEPNSETYSLILDDLHISFLLRATQAHKGAHVLAAPQVLCQEGKTASIGIMTEDYYVLGYTEPNDPSDKPVPKKDKVEIGTRIWLKPELTPDNENIKLDFKLEIRQLLGYEERKHKGKYIYMVPRTEVVSTKMPCLIPDGKTLLIGGLKIIEQVEHQSDAPRLSDLPLIGVVFSRSTKTRDNKILLILVKPIINPQQKASKILPGQENAEEHIKHLGRLLEKKLNPPAEPR